MLRKTLIFLAIAIPLGYGGAKLYVAHSIHRTADELIAAVSPVAEIKYEGTTSSLFGGMIGLTGITVQALRGGGFYRIGAVKLRSANIFSLVGIDVAQDKMPNSFDIEIDNFSMPLSGDMLENDHGDLGLLGDLRTPIGVLGCGRRSSFSVSDLADMGIDHITPSMNVKVVREPVRNDVRVMLHVDTPGINAVNADVSFASPGGNLDPNAVTSRAPTLKSLSFTFRDQGWHERVQKFCTAQTGMTRTAYLDAHMTAVKAALTRMGFTVSNDLIEAYRNFLEDGGSMNLSLTPQSPVDFGTLHLYTLQQAIDLMAPTLRVNGKIVKQLDVARTGSETASRTMADVAAVPAADQGSYEAIPLDTLDRYVGRQVSLTTDSDHVFSGKLVSVGDRIATVNVTTYGQTRQDIVLLSRVAKSELMIPAGTATSGAH